MIIFRVLRIALTAVLIVFLLATGFLALLAYSINNVVATSEYVGNDLLYSGIYSEMYTYVIDKYVPMENPDDMAARAEGEITTSIIHSIKPTVFSNITAQYLAGWMEYLLAEVPDNQIPVLNLEPYKSSIFSSAVALLEDEEFLMALVDEQLKERGDSISNYNEDDIAELVAGMNIEQQYMDSVEQAMSAPNSIYYKTVLNNDPLAILRIAAPELSDEEITAKVKSYYGILGYYKSIANLIFAGILACMGLIFIMWLDRISIPFLINGLVTLLSAIPLFIISTSEQAFNKLVLFASRYIPESVPDITNFDFYNNLAIMPVIDFMLIVSGIAIAIGLIFILLSILLRKEKKPAKLRPDL
ncbi:MAG: hypothetical protein JXN65_08225 [Clostridia bacterium]|nr:hypothetical protein [Clostridia bacterium]